MKKTIQTSKARLRNRAVPYFAIYKASCVSFHRQLGLPRTALPTQTKLHKRETKADRQEERDATTPSSCSLQTPIARTSNPIKKNRPRLWYPSAPPIACVRVPASIPPLPRRLLILLNLLRRQHGLLRPLPRFFPPLHMRRRLQEHPVPHPHHSSSIRAERRLRPWLIRVQWMRGIAVDPVFELRVVIRVGHALDALVVFAPVGCCWAGLAHVGVFVWMAGGLGVARIGAGPA